MDGVKNETSGKLEAGKVPIEQLKEEYASLAKRSYGAQRAQAQNAVLREMHLDPTSEEDRQKRLKKIEADSSVFIPMTRKSPEAKRGRAISI